MRKKIIIALLLILLLIFSLALFSVFFSNTINKKSSKIIQVSSAMRIFKSGNYQLTTQIDQPVNGSCTFFGIYSSDVVFDGMGYTIDGSHLAPSCTSIYGFNIRDTPGDKITRSGIIIKNVTLSNMSYPLTIHTVHNLRVEDVTITNVKQGINIDSSSNVFLVNNTIKNSIQPGISGKDNEKVTIDGNRITDSGSYGIQLDGGQYAILIPPKINLYGVSSINIPMDIVNSSLTIKRTTSGTKYVISHNTIQNTSLYGISIRFIDDINVTENTILKNSARQCNNCVIQCSNCGILCDNCGPKQVIEKNYGNVSINRSSGHYSLSWSTIIGMLLLLLFSATPTIGSKVVQNKFLNYIWIKSLKLENTIRSFIQKRRISIIFETFIAIILIGIVIFGAAFAYKTLLEFDWQSFFILLFISGIVTIVPRAVQYLSALRKDLDADLRLWWGGISVIIITLLPLFGSIFGQPLKMVIQDEATRDKRAIFITNIVGPITTIILGILFFLLYTTNTFSPYSLTGMQMCFLISVVMLMPISPMEGVKVWSQNKIIWALLFFPVLVAYLISLLLQYTFLSAFTIF